MNNNFKVVIPFSLLPMNIYYKKKNKYFLLKRNIIQFSYCKYSPGTRDHQLRVSRIWMALVQDDDIRVPFGKAHDHAREIVEKHDALKILTKSLTQYANVRLIYYYS